MSFYRSAEGAGSISTRGPQGKGMFEVIIIRNASATYSRSTKADPARTFRGREAFVVRADRPMAGGLVREKSAPSASMRAKKAQHAAAMEWQNGALGTFL